MNPGISRTFFTGDRTAAAVPNLLATAQDLLTLAQTDPRLAKRRAGTFVADPTVRHHREAFAVAERALGMAARELNDLRGAEHHLRRSVEIAAAAGLPARSAEARVHLSVALLLQGNTKDALRQATRAAGALRGAEGARLQMLRALVLQRLGHLDEALAAYRPALSALQRAGEPTAVARLLSDRGILHAYRGDLARAERDLSRAEALHAEHGATLAAAEVRHNLGFVAARRGDYPTALARYDAAEREFRRSGVERPVALLDRCEALLGARLVAEAGEVASRAVDQLTAQGMWADVAEARLMVAEAALLAGDWAGARRAAETALGDFARQHRPGWAALARYAALRAAWLGGDHHAGTRRNAAKVVEELKVAGLPVAAVDAQLIHARMTLSAGYAVDAERGLRALSAARRSGPADLRVRAWHAEALLRVDKHDDRGAQRALEAGLRVAQQQQAQLGATELRVHAAVRSQELAELGLSLARRTGRAPTVFRWAERSRAMSMRTPRARPPANAALSRLLNELRQVTAEMESAAVSGRDTSALVRHQVGLERATRELARQQPGGAPGLSIEPPTVTEVTAALGERALLELVACEGDLLAVVIAGGRASLHELGRLAGLDRELASLRFALHRLARERGSRASLGAASEVVRHATRQIDHIFSPATARIGDRPAVIVPTGGLHTLPWSILPSHRGRAVVVAPSAALWLQAARANGRHPDDRAVLVAGPGVPAAHAEVHHLRRLYPGATVITGPAATVDHVCDALDGAGLVHIAAHGFFRDDNAQFSSLLLADGRLTVYQLETLRQAPRWLVMSACDSGMASVNPGDELMGFSSALLSMGTHTLVASVATLPDETTRTMMGDFHERWRAGASAAEALAGAQAAMDAGHPTSLAARAGFVCIGAG